jgi:hypothetical protein
MHVWCCTDDTDAALLDIFGLAQDEGYATMGSYMRKYVVFAAAEHTEDFPLLPIFPLQLSSLIRYGWYLQFHGVRGGIHSIRNYLSAITEANSAAGHPDPRAAEPWTWRKFRLNVPKHLLVVDPAKTKLALRVPHMHAVALDADYSRADDLDDLSSYALAWFSAVRVGHRNRGPTLTASTFSGGSTSPPSVGRRTNVHLHTHRVHKDPRSKEGRPVVDGDRAQ